MLGQRFAIALCLSFGFAGAAAAQDSTRNVSAAIGDSASAAAHLATAGVQTVASVAVVPVSVAASGVYAAGSTVRAVGGDSMKAGRDLWSAGVDSASFASTPLPVDKAVVVKAQPAPRVPYAANAAPAVSPTH